MSLVRIADPESQLGQPDAGRAGCGQETLETQHPVQELRTVPDRSDEAPVELALCHTGPSGQSGDVCDGGASLPQLYGGLYDRVWLLDRTKPAKDASFEHGACLSHRGTRGQPVCDDFGIVPKPIEGDPLIA
jgi:hypothetical protein